VLIKPLPFVLLTIHIIWNRETEAEARVCPCRPAAQKAIDKTTTGFAGLSATKRGAAMRLVAPRKA